MGDWGEAGCALGESSSKHVNTFTVWCHHRWLHKGNKLAVRYSLIIEFCGLTWSLQFRNMWWRQRSGLILRWVLQSNRASLSLVVKCIYNFHIKAGNDITNLRQLVPARWIEKPITNTGWSKNIIGVEWPVTLMVHAGNSAPWIFQKHYFY